MPVAKQILDWATVNVAPDVISRYLSKGKVPPAKSKSFDADDMASGHISSWLTLDPNELAELFVDGIPAKSNILAENDVLPVFNQLKHKLMHDNGTRYPGWDNYRWSGIQDWTEFKPTYDIDFDAAARLMRALDRNRPELTQQAADILQNNLRYYKAK